MSIFYLKPAPMAPTIESQTFPFNLAWRAALQGHCITRVLWDGQYTVFLAPATELPLRTLDSVSWLPKAVIRQLRRPHGSQTHRPTGEEITVPISSILYVLLPTGEIIVQEFTSEDRKATDWIILD
ncbi:hypothetical protein EAH73_01665 [Hymenobacter nivis]|uniref:Uncharacterized protein n=1 Tax=Hymenobacter nivis TaxID=1850093 RepID=A0A502HFG1_9BACT|nr:hypothetical protein EAH73_01665 [Hymenobacter nivis]